MKKFRNIAMMSAACLALSGVTAALPVGAAVVQAETLEDYTYEVNGGEVTITKYNGPSAVTEIEIPAEIDGMPVTAIGERMFMFNRTLTAVVIPDSVKTIGESAFQGCTKLESVNIPAGLTTLANHAFDSCRSIRSVNIPAGVTSIGENAFNGCSMLESVEIAYGVKEIGSYAFLNCAAIESIELPESVTSIGWEAFRLCKKLTSATIPDSVTNIGGAAFSGTPWLETLQAQNPLVVIGSVLYYADAAACIGEVVIPDGVVMICRNVFMNHTEMTSVVMPDSLTTIGNQAFYGCSALTDIVLSENLTQIENYAFDNTPWLAQKLEENPLVVIGTSLYAVNKELCAGEIVIPEQVTAIPDNAFSGCAEITSVVMPDSVTSIGNSAFYNCTALTNIVLPKHLTQIDTYAFEETPWLTQMLEENPMLVIGSMLYAVNPETCVGDIVIPKQVTKIANGVFSECTGITSVIIPDGVQMEVMGTFYNCSALTKIVLPDGIQAIGESSLSGCTSLTEIVIPKSVQYISFFAFKDCNNLTDVYYTGTEQEWQSIYIEYAYQGNDALRNATIHYNYVPEKAPDDEFITGDLNGDGAVGIEDAIICLQWATELIAGNDLGLTPVQITAADIDGDGEITAVDAVLIMAYYVNNVVAEKDLSWDDIRSGNF